MTTRYSILSSTHSNDCYITTARPRWLKLWWVTVNRWTTKFTSFYLQVLLSSCRGRKLFRPPTYMYKTAKCLCTHFAMVQAMSATSKVHLLRDITICLINQSLATKQIPEADNAILTFNTFRWKDVEIHADWYPTNLSTADNPKSKLSR